MIRGNTALNNRAGIELYAASGNNLAIVDNHLTNNDGILLRTAHSLMGSANVLNPISNVQVLNNTVTHTAASPYEHIPAYIGVLTLQEKTTTIGAHTVGVEIKGNTVTGLTGYTPLPDGTQHYPNNNKLNTEGFYNYLITNFFDPAYPTDPRYFGNNGDTPIMIGTIFQNNTAVNCTSAYHLNSGAYSTLICSPTLVNTPNLVSDTYAGNAPIIAGRHTSVNTVICPHDMVLRNPENPSSIAAGLQYNYYIGAWNAIPNYSTLTPISTGTATAINLTYASASDNFGLQFNGYVTVPTDGVYTFYTNSDDGSNLYIGSTKVVDNDGSHGPQEHSGTIGLKAGTHAFRVDYFESGGGENLSVNYEGPSISKQTIPAASLKHSTLRVPENPSGTVAGLNGQYYEGSWSTLPNFSSLTPVCSGGTNDINLGPAQRNWGFGLQFTGYVTVPTNGTYTFYTSSDDGSKLYIGSTEVVDNDGGHATQERSGTIDLAAGTHAFKVVYFQNGGGETLDVAYQGPSISKQAIPTSAYRR